MQYHTGLAMISVQFTQSETLFTFEELEHTTSRIPKFRIPHKSWVRLAEGNDQRLFSKEPNEV